MVEVKSIRYVLSPREQELLSTIVGRRSVKAGKTVSESSDVSTPAQYDYNAAAFRSASRVFLATTSSLTLAEAVLNQLSARKKVVANATPRKTLVASKSRLALSLSALLFFHRIFYRLFTRLRLQLLHEKVKGIRQRYPRVYAALTSGVAPAIGASLSGFALGICPSDQLRVTIAIYVACRALERAYSAFESAGYLKNKPWWFGSWLLFPLAQGQLLHAFVFDRDCFPEAYGSFILKYTPDYIQRRPDTLSAKVTWPKYNQIVDALAEMARLKWPPFVSPILHPGIANTLPKSVDTVISPITSRANPSLQHLSCALIHPAEPSCFTAYLHQNLKAFPLLARFFAMYYGALSLLRIKQLYKSPVAFLNRLSQQILKTTVAISGAIGMSWGSICLFAAILPRSFIPQFRFFVGGLLGGMFQIIDRTSAGHANSLYAARTSVDSLWKVGVKRRWWRPIKGADVLLFVTALAITNAAYDLGTSEEGAAVLKVLRGEIEIGLQEKQTVKEGSKAVSSEQSETEREE